MRGGRHSGLGLLDLATAPGPRRAVGEVVARCELADVGLLTGFANHRGATTLGAGARPLGRVLAGPGNDTRSRRRHGLEGAIGGNVVATYLHGPVLARNPALADHLLGRVTGRPFIGLAPVPDIPDLPSLRRSYLSPIRR